MLAVLSTDASVRLFSVARSVCVPEQPGPYALKLWLEPELMRMPHAVKCAAHAAELVGSEIST